MEQLLADYTGSFIEYPRASAVDDIHFTMGKVRTRGLGVGFKDKQTAEEAIRVITDKVVEYRHQTKIRGLLKRAKKTLESKSLCSFFHFTTSPNFLRDPPLYKGTSLSRGGR